MPAMAVLTDDPVREDRISPVSSLRDRLKQATSKAHRELDERLGAFDISAVDGYRRFLEANAAALLPLERTLERSGVAEIFTDWQYRSRTAAVVADLAKVGGTVRPLAPMQAANSKMNRNILLGTMYVLEGSRLGAQYLMRGIAASTDPVIPTATAYLTHGAGRQLWKSFLTVLEREPRASADRAEVEEGAQLAFATFAQAAAAA